MKWFILFVGVIVVCCVVALILGLASGAMSRPTSSLSHEPLPDDPIEDADFDDLAFDIAARGYRMSQVDGVVDRLRRELREKDAEIAVLRGEVPEGPDADETRTGKSPEFDVAKDLPAVEAAEDRPADEAVVEPAEEQTAEPAEEPSAEPVAEPVAEAAAEPTADAHNQPAEEPADAPADETAEETADQVPAVKQPAARGSRSRPAARRRPTT